MCLSKSKVKRAVSAGAFALFALSAACAQQMASQPRYKAYEKSTCFADGRSARPLVRGVVPRNAPVESTAQPAATAASLKRGRERFNIYCSPCHGLAGYGDGMIPERGLSRPPSFHTEQMRAYPASHFFEVMTHGYGAMPSYATQISVADRWAIIGYIRALQLSQNARPDDAPPEEWRKLASGGTQ